jgi:Glyoxalase/Bleomycin resistance protein/Dioxygenase superfamily
MSESKFLGVRLVIPVVDIYDTMAWYERVLGMKTLYIHRHDRRGEQEDFANYVSMRHDTAAIHSMIDEGGPAWTRSAAGTHTCASVT